jgi:hypothetical protein
MITSLNEKASCPNAGCAEKNCSNIFITKAVREKEYSQRHIKGVV